MSEIEKCVCGRSPDVDRQIGKVFCGVCGIHIYGHTDGRVKVWNSLMRAARERDKLLTSVEMLEVVHAGDLQELRRLREQVDDRKELVDRVACLNAERAKALGERNVLREEVERLTAALGTEKAVAVNLLKSAPHQSVEVNEMIRNCGTCRFYLDRMCHRFPPFHDPHNRGVWTHPFVGGVETPDFCGEWKARD